VLVRESNADVVVIVREYQQGPPGQELPYVSGKPPSAGCAPMTGEPTDHPVAAFVPK
jgi:hypothetical protein